MIRNQYKFTVMMEHYNLHIVVMHQFIQYQHITIIIMNWEYFLKIIHLWYVVKRAIKVYIILNMTIYIMWHNLLYIFKVEGWLLQLKMICWSIGDFNVIRWSIFIAVVSVLIVHQRVLLAICIQEDAWLVFRIINWLGHIANYLMFQ